MRKSWWMCVLLSTLAWGQAAPSAPAAPQAPADTSADVPATAAVITIKGVCAPQPKPAAAKTTAAKPATPAKTTAAKSSADCKTVITKAEFEKLASHLAPNVTPQMKKQLASLLPRWIAMSDEAKQKGLDKTPQFEDRVKVLKMQILGQELQQQIQEDAAKISPEEIEKYYKEHADSYQQLNLDRLFVPRTKQPEPEASKEEDKNEKLSEEAQKAKQAEEKAKVEEGEQAMTKLAESLRARAAAGEDFAKLQKEAFEAAGMKLQAPTVNLPTVRRNTLPPAQAVVFDLKAGEVSQVINDAGGHYIYKVNSKSEIPLDQATTEIHSKLQNDRTRQKMDELNNSFKVETNEAYFGPTPPAGPMGGRPGPGQMAPQQRMQNQSHAPTGAAPSQPQPPQAQPPTAPPELMAKPVVVVTGVSGNLGSRLLPLLGSYTVIGVDVNAPQTTSELQFERLDLGEEPSTRPLYELLRDTHAYAMIHLAFVVDPVRTGVLDIERMWQINVAGTARVMEAVTEANRATDDGIKQFIFPSSVSAYGSNLPAPATEESVLAAHTLPYAIHKKQSDEVVQTRSHALRGCSAYILRPHIFAGASVDNYLMGAFRGTPNGQSKRAEKMRKEGKRLPCLLPRGPQYLDNKIQFIHVDDMARLIRHILQREPETQRLTMLNVAGRGEPLTFGRCVEIAQAKLVRVPGKWAMRQVLKFLWKQKISAIPPDAVPYMTGEYIMNTDRLRRFLGPEYEHVIRYTVTDAFADSFHPDAAAS